MANARSILHSLGVSIDTTRNRYWDFGKFIKEIRLNGRKILGEQQPAIAELNPEDVTPHELIETINKIIHTLEAHGLTSDTLEDESAESPDTLSTSLLSIEMEPNNPPAENPEGKVGTGGAATVGQPNPTTGDSPAQPDLEGVDPASGRREGVTNSAGSAFEPLPPRIPEEEMKELSDELQESFEPSEEEEDTSFEEEENTSPEEEEEKAPTRKSRKSR